MQVTSLPKIYEGLPGVSEPFGKTATQKTSQEGVAATDAKAPNLASETANAATREAMKKDIEGNQELVAALAAYNLNPTAEGLARVLAAGRGSPESFGELVGALKLAGLANGESAQLNNNLKVANDKFINGSDFRALDAGELAFIEARLLLETQSKERDEAMELLKKAVKDAEADLAKLEKQQDLFDRAYGDDGKVEDPAAAQELAESGFEVQDAKTAPPEADTSGDGKVDKVEAAQYSENQITDQIDATKEHLRTLREALAKALSGEADNKTGATGDDESMLELLNKMMNDIKQGAQNKATAGVPGVPDANAGEGANIP